MGVGRLTDVIWRAVGVAIFKVEAGSSVDVNDGGAIGVTRVCVVSALISVGRVVGNSARVGNAMTCAPESLDCPHPVRKMLKNKIMSIIIFMLFSLLPSRTYRLWR